MSPKNPTGISTAKSRGTWTRHPGPRVKVMGEKRSRPTDVGPFREGTTAFSPISRTGKIGPLDIFTIFVSKQIYKMI